MKLPAEVIATRDRYVAARPLWTMPPSEAAEHKARDWTLGFIMQVGFEHPTLNFGSKKADGGRPLSKDSIAQPQRDGRLLSWDLLSGAGTGSPALVQNPESQDITGQVFKPIERRDVLGGQAVDPPASPPPAPPGGVPPYWGDDKSTAAFGDLIVTLLKDYARAGNPIDRGIGVWLGRTMYDVMTVGEPVASALPRHRAEWCAILGIPVV